MKFRLCDGELPVIKDGVLSKQICVGKGNSCASASLGCLQPRKLLQPFEDFIEYFAVFTEETDPEGYGLKLFCYWLLK